jgi:hypothetical protein
VSRYEAGLRVLFGKMLEKNKGISLLGAGISDSYQTNEDDETNGRKQGKGNQASTLGKKKEKTIRNGRLNGVAGGSGKGN